MWQTGLDTARKHVSPIECFPDGVFGPYLENKCVGGRGRSGMGGTEKREQDMRSLRQSGILTGH